MYLPKATQLVCLGARLKSRLSEVMMCHTCASLLASLDFIKCSHFSLVKLLSSGKLLVSDSLGILVYGFINAEISHHACYKL